MVDEIYHYFCVPTFMDLVREYVSNNIQGGNKIENIHNIANL